MTREEEKARFDAELALAARRLERHYIGLWLRTLASRLESGNGDLLLILADQIEAAEHMRTDPPVAQPDTGNPITEQHQ